MYSILVELMANALDVTVLTMLFCKRFPAKYKTIIPNLIFIATFYLVESLPVLFELSYYPIETMLFLLCFVYLLFRNGSIVHKLFWVSISFVTIFALAMIVSPIISIISGFDVKEMNNSLFLSGRIIYLVIANIIKLIVFYLLAYTPRRIQKNHMSMLVCLFIPAVSVIFGIWICKIYVINDSYSSTDYIIFLLAISYLLVSIFSFVLYEIIERDSEKMVYLLAKENQYATMVQYTEQIKHTNNEIRIWQHDMKQHLSCLHSLLEQKDYEGAVTYLDSFSTNVKLSYLKINSGNYLADAILSAKVNIACSKGIKVGCSASLPDELPIDDVDFCSVLSNIMDNAIEACELVKGKTYIECNIITIRDQLVIEVENSSTGIYKMSNGIFKSLKKSGIHGIGLMQTHHIIDKYEGICSINAMDNLFRIRISIPLK